MARPAKKPKESTKTTPKAEGRWSTNNDSPWGGFINVRLDDEQKADYEVWVSENPNEPWRLLDDLLGEGMKVGFSYDSENECYILTFTGALVDGSTERYCLTSRAGTLPDVVAVGTWKHFVLLKQNYGDLRANGRKNNWG